MFFWKLCLGKKFQAFKKSKNWSSRGSLKVLENRYDIAYTQLLKNERYFNASAHINSAEGTAVFELIYFPSFPLPHGKMLLGVCHPPVTLQKGYFTFPSSVSMPELQFLPPMKLHLQIFTGREGVNFAWIRYYSNTNTKVILNLEFSMTRN